MVRTEIYKVELTLESSSFLANKNTQLSFLSKPLLM